MTTYTHFHEDEIVVYVDECPVCKNNPETVPVILESPKRH
jgi:hypothetical protein